MVKLSSELKRTQPKADLIDKLREDHAEELSRVKSRYETQISGILKTLETKDKLIKSLQSNLKNIRSMLEENKVVLAAPTAAGAVVSEVPEAPPTPTNLLTGVAPINSSAEFHPSTGAVLMINQDYQFIVVDIGAAEGAQVGRFVQIYQKGQIIGQGRIDRVYQDLSAATILSEDTIAHVQQGDQVVLALS